MMFCLGEQSLDLSLSLLWPLDVPVSLSEVVVFMQ